MRSLIFCLVLLSSSLSLAQEKLEFIRAVKDGEKLTALETPIISYANKDQQVDLVGVIHIGDKSYYESLNEEFKKYDIVLYELVAPKGTKPDTEKKAPGWVQSIQSTLKSAMQLEHQLQIVDYKAPNMVHADLSFAEMQEVLKAQGEDAFTIGFGFAADFKRMYNKAKIDAAKPQINLPEEEVDLVALFLGSRLEGKKLKRAFAESLQKGTNDDLVTLNRLLIEERNKACLKELTNHSKKKVAIFYGAAHLPDFDRRLRADRDYQVKSVRWLKAWDLK